MRKAMLLSFGTNDSDILWPILLPAFLKHTHQVMGYDWAPLVWKWGMPQMGIVKWGKWWSSIGIRRITFQTHPCCRLRGHHLFQRTYFSVFLNHSQHSKCLAATEIHSEITDGNPLVQAAMMTTYRNIQSHCKRFSKDVNKQIQMIIRQSIEQDKCSTLYILIFVWYSGSPGPGAVFRP